MRARHPVASSVDRLCQNSHFGMLSEFRHIGVHLPHLSPLSGMREMRLFGKVYEGYS